MSSTHAERRVNHYKAETWRTSMSMSVVDGYKEPQHKDQADLLAKAKAKRELGFLRRAVEAVSKDAKAWVSQPEHLVVEPGAKRMYLKYGFTHARMMGRQSLTGKQRILCSMRGLKVDYRKGAYYYVYDASGGDRAFRMYLESDWLDDMEEKSLECPLIRKDLEKIRKAGAPA